MKLAKTLAMLGALLAIAAMPVMGQFQEEDTSAIIAPVSIPLDINGDAPAQVAMFRLEVSTKGDTLPAEWREVVSMDVTLTGTISADQIAAVRIYWEEQDLGDPLENDGIYNGTDSGGELLGSGDFLGGSPVTIMLSDNYVRNRTAGYGYAMFYVIYEFADGSVPEALTGAETVGAQVSNIGHRPDGGGTIVYYNDTTPPTPTNSDIDDYELTMLGSTVGLTFPSPTPGAVVTALRLQFGAADASLSAAARPLLETVTIDEINSAGAADIDQLLLFTDVNANDIYDDGTDELHGTATVSASSTAISVSATDQLVTPPFTYAMDIADGNEYLVAIQIAASATDGNVVQLQVPDAVSASLTFHDSIDDSGSVDLTREYAQSGFLDPTHGSYESPTPASPGSFTILPAPDITEPNVIASNPADEAIDVSKDLAQVTLTFDDVMFDDAGGGLPASVTTLGNYSMTGPTAVTLTGVTFDSPTSRSTLTVDGASLPLQYSGLYTVTVANVENTDGLAIQFGVNDSISFTIEPATPPQVSSTTPADTATAVSRTTNVIIVFSEDMDHTTVTNTNFLMSGSVSGVVDDSTGFAFDDGTNTITFTPPALLGYGEVYTVTLTAANIYDDEGTSLEAWTGGGDYSMSFTVDSTEFKVSSTTPASDATDVLRDAEITVVFNDDVDAATAIAGKFSLMEDPDGAATSTTGAFVFDDLSSTITFTPDALLTYDAVYEVTLSGSIANEDGSLLSEWSEAAGGDYSYRFTVEPKTPPEVSDTNPNAGAVGVARDATVEIVFSEAMDVGTLVEANFSMIDDAAADVSGTFGVTGDRTITFAPTDPLDYETVYTVQLDSVSILDAEGTTLFDWAGTDPYEFQFTTVANVPPTVLVSIPVNGANDAGIGTTVSVVFSEAMDEATVTNDANFSLTETGGTDEIAGALNYSADANTVTFTPDASFSFSTSYTATVTTGVTDAEGSPLAVDHTFTFTTASAAASLSFTDIIVANNRIVPGSTDPMRIFIETPEGLAGTDVVTIQVYTSTGRRVATLTTAGETYADVIARQPILWDGTNGRGQPLGPGLYFVQVNSAGYRRALRVMIVR